MYIFTISDNKKFMNQLLKNDLFDTFLVREIILYTNIKYIIDGTLNKDFYVSENLPAAPYMSWEFLRPKIHFLLANKDVPSYFKIIFSTTKENTEQISDQAQTFFLNIIYKDNITTITTSWTPKTFTLDKTPEQEWDKKMEKFLCKWNFI